ncbi:carbohydrate-binding protein [Arenibacter aquaticus]|uniref:Carbohydrate-binding protein n=1 Tax=Arenibacter aquaticus TaxID=2489054 RepID=A0A430K459_9FLAO|nr:carbohydrate-binding protein [Arenibacter aquaticus]RTE53906.1 carbohydrate-binding protein [Arenibacter aquaticus]
MQKKLPCKQLLTLYLLAITSSVFAQDLFFEQSNGTSSTFGQIDVYQQSSNSLRENIDVNAAFDKTEGWELLALDGSNYYFQITDMTSSNYGQIDIWDNKTKTRSNYGNLSSIFPDPTNWKLGGADNAILYFGSAVENSEIVSWDGTTISTFAHLRDVVVFPKYWRFAGFHNGVMYIEWTNASNARPSIKTWNGSKSVGTYDNTNYYDAYDDAYLFGVSNFIVTDNSQLLVELEKVKNHILGTATLSAADLKAVGNAIAMDNILFTDNYDVINQGLEVIELYESQFGGLFTTGTTTKGGFSRTASGYELENLMLVLMQSVLDHSYTEANLSAYPQLFNNRLFKTSSYFPGAVAQPADPSQSFTIKINGTHVRKPGTQANYETEDARRPTGCYLAPGSVAKVTVPSSLVGIGATILVGAHTWDLSKKSTIKRMDRVTTKYEINSTTTTIANPLGGGVYINVPYQKDLGILNITLENVVRSPYYARTAANQTSLSDWLNVERLRGAPWTDIETDKVMMQVPTSWIYAYDDIETAMNDWDMSMDAISTLLGRPLLRSKTVIYMQVDVIKRGSANFPGYPQSNVSYNPYKDYGGYYNNYLINGPRHERGYLTNVLFHEQGHAEKVYKFKGEIESFVNFLWVAVHNKKFGVELNKAFEESFNGYGLSHTLEEAAISWMITENFRNGNPMSTQTGQYRQELSYQPRGHAKYADLVRLFNWEALEQFYANTSESYEKGEIDYSANVNAVPTDDRLLRMSQAAGYDLRPLIHFWGIHPDDNSSLETAIQNSNLKKSTAIYDQLSYYKTIVPMDNTAFRDFGLVDYSENRIQNSSYFNHTAQSYYPGFFKKWWDGYNEPEGQAAVDQIQSILDLYFPDGRPEEENTSCLEIKPLSVISSSATSPENTLDNDPATAWTAQGKGEYLLYDLGEVYELCDLGINFENGQTRFDYFDIEVSRDNQTFLAVKQDLSSTKTTASFDTYSISRKARYVKIIGRGNETDDWNSISDVKFYFKRELPFADIDPYSRIEAEDYFLANSAEEVPTTDVDGDLDLHVNDGGWIAFNSLDLSEAGSIILRIASTVDNGMIEIRKGAYNGELVTTVAVPNTGSENSWETLKTEFPSLEGEDNYYLTFKGAESNAFKINWLQFLKQPIIIENSTTIEAEDYFLQSGVEVQPTLDLDGGEQIGTIDHGDYISFDLDVQSSGVYNVSLRISPLVAASSIILRKDDGSYEEVAVPDANDDEPWQTITTYLKLASGVQSLRFEFEGGDSNLLNLNWIKFDLTGLDLQLISQNKGSATNNSIQADLEIVNLGADTINLDDLTVRYWFTAEDYASLDFWCDYAQIGNQNISAQFENSSPPRSGGLTYLELSFTGGIELNTQSSTGIIQTRFAKSDWTDFDETDDYSYKPSNNFIENEQITIYKDGALIWGEEPEIEEASTSLVAEYKPGNPVKSSDNQIKPHFQIKNTGNTAIPLSSITLKYWFTPEGSQDINFIVDWAKMGENSIVGIVHDSKDGTNKYLEVSFNSNDTLHSLSGTGEIRSRLHKTDWSSFDETDDYSYIDTRNYESNQKIALYVDNSLVWGVEPENNLAANKVFTAEKSIAEDNPISPELNEVAVDVYPNPVTEFVTIVNKESESRIELYDYTGRFILSNNTMKHQHVIDLQSLAKGLYIVYVYNNEGSVVLKKIIKK